MVASGSWVWARVQWSWTLEPLWVKTSRGPSMPRLGTGQGQGQCGLLILCYQVTEHSQLDKHAEFLCHTDLTLVSPAVSRSHGAEKDNVRTCLLFCPSGVGRQFSSKLSSLSKILSNIVLLGFVWTFCQCHTKPANSFFCGGIIFILIAQYLLSVKLLIVSTTFYQQNWLLLRRILKSLSNLFKFLLCIWL